ncbi:MAG TPA: hypothetical protein VEG08_11470 [Terriglobales bacterium]|nr:hypothetical protein [Terriglobales bacterium]
MRRSWLLIAVGALSTLALGAGTPAPQPDLTLLKQRARVAKPADAALANMRVVEAEVDAADQYYKDGDVEKAEAAVAEAVHYAELAVEAAQKSPKHLKQPEIILREAGRRLEEIRRSLAFDDQPPVQKAEDRLEKVRRDLLHLMFAPPK